MGTYGPLSYRSQALAPTDAANTTNGRRSLWMAFAVTVRWSQDGRVEGTGVEVTAVRVNGQLRPARDVTRERRITSGKTCVLRIIVVFGEAMDSNPASGLCGAALRPPTRARCNL